MLQISETNNSEWKKLFHVLGSLALAQLKPGLKRCHQDLVSLPFKSWLCVLSVHVILCPAQS